MSEIREFPFELPQGFLPKLGYSGEQQFVALRWDFEGDNLICEDGKCRSSGLDDWMWRDYLDALGVSQWLMDHDVYLGDASTPATHAFVIDRYTGDAYITLVETAMMVVGQQLLT